MTRVMWALAAAGAVGSAVLVLTAKAPGAQCAEGFYPVGHRCCPAVSGDGETCGPARTCPSPLAQEAGECVAPDARVTVPETRITVGPSDWEADGVVHPREIHVRPFTIDAFEITIGAIRPEVAGSDGARAAGSLKRTEIEWFCARRGGRLPTEDEWIAAASGATATRYPWGDTGAVCRRVAWGLVDGPCAHGARGPDTVGAHNTGDTPLGIHDMAGNVAEWTSTDAHGRGVVLGGSYKSQLAADLRVWARKEVDVDIEDPSIGGRCAYDLRYPP